MCRIWIEGTYLDIGVKLRLRAKIVSWNPARLGNCLLSNVCTAFMILSLSSFPVWRIISSRLYSPRSWIHQFNSGSSSSESDTIIISEITETCQKHRLLILGLLILLRLSFVRVIPTASFVNPSRRAAIKIENKFINNYNSCLIQITSFPFLRVSLPGKSPLSAPLAFDKGRVTLRKSIKKRNINL